MFLLKFSHTFNFDSGNTVLFSVCHKCREMMYFFLKVGLGLGRLEHQEKMERRTRLQKYINIYTTICNIGSQWELAV